MFSNNLSGAKQIEEGSGDLMSQFVSLVRTKYDQETLLKEIDLVLESLYLTGDKSFEEILTKKLRAETAALIKETKSREKNFQGFIKSLRQVLIELKQIDITIAIEPSEQLINQTYEWIKRSLKDSLVINFYKNSELVGGAQIAYKGKYFEFSLRKALQEELKMDKVIG